MLLFSSRSIADHLDTVLPNLETLILTNNNIEELTEIDRLKSFKSLRTLW